MADHPKGIPIACPTSLRLINTYVPTLCNCAFLRFAPIRKTALPENISLSLLLYIQQPFHIHTEDVFLFFLADFSHSHPSKRRPWIHKWKIGSKKQLF